MPDDWPWEPDTTLTRREVHHMLGGNAQSGITKPAKSRDVLLFTNIGTSRRYGYDRFEGHRSDGGYSYTGEGQRGDQSMTGGNFRILETNETGGLLRLFKAMSPNATYVGSFTLGDPPFETRRIFDVDRNERSGFIFNLVPVNADTALLPAYGGIELAEISASDWTEPDPSAFEFRLLEAEATRTVSRLEFQLQLDFGTWLKAQGFSPQNLRIPVDGAAIQPDVYEPATGLVVEAKKSSGRAYVRQALGQVLDYDFCIRGAGRASVPAILLPSAPTSDLIELCDECEVAVIVPFEGGFVTRGAISLTAVPAAH